ncbi:helix-turn-helix domain-containing protein [Metasolibacillus meyeri]|uniref:helix-turn-helix domain-containing protein n=1 Tax=Metasolibacillus meyeri TaxID=1071052 RepID=UPI000D30C558|nr:helix-turn-helix domain-containing protein [Metasolibacillus meyeri]
MLGKELYYYRKKQGFTQQELADGICSIPYLSKIENDKISPNPETVKLLFQRLGMNFNQIPQQNHYENSITDWYKNIEENNRALADKIMLELKRDLHFIQSPSIESYFYLIKWRYDLSYTNMEQIESSYIKVKSYIDVFTENLHYLYFKFSCIYYYKKGEFDVALTQGKKANQLREKLELVDVELQYILAVTFSQLNSTSLAIIYAQKALHVFQQQNNLLRIMDCQMLLGISLARIKEFDEANYYYQAVLKLSHHIKREFPIQATIYHNLGYLYSQKKNSELAIEYYLKAFEKKEGNLDQSLLGTIYLLANEYYLIGKKKDAKKWVTTGLTIPLNLSTSQINLTTLNYLMDEESDDLASYLKEIALPFFQNKKDWKNISKYSVLLGDYYSKKAHYKDAANYYKAAYIAGENLYN